MKINIFLRSLKPSGALWQAIKRTFTRRWSLKLFSLLIAVGLWGVLITSNPDLTREKIFNGVEITIANREVLKRNGLVVISGLENLEKINMRVDVPQKSYDASSPANYNVRVDLSRISQTGKQSIPILTTSSNTYGQVRHLSTSEIVVTVDNYISRSRIPVQIREEGSVPEGFFGTTPTIDPSTVTISGPRSLVQNIVRCVAFYDKSTLVPIGRTQINAIPFKLFTNDDKEVSGDIEVTSDSIALDSFLVEQTLYPLYSVPVNTSAVTTGKVAKGYEIVNISVDPTTIYVAGFDDSASNMAMVDLEVPLNIAGATETIVRQIKLIRPSNLVHMSNNAVYVTVEIAKIGEETNK